MTHAPTPYPHITVTQGMAGWFAVMITNYDGFPEPECSGMGRYQMQADAIIEGQQWAEAEELPFIMPHIVTEPARQDVMEQLKEILPDINIIEIGDDDE